MPYAQPCARSLAPTIEPIAAVTLPGLTSAALRLSERADLVRTRIRYLRSHPERLAQIAGQSYWHSHGFAKVKVLEGRDICVRLHIWPEGKGRIADDGPHGHRWDFASWVAVGAGMSETYFTEVDQADPGAAAHDGYEYGREEGIPFLWPTDVTWLRAATPRIHSTGAVYECSRGVVHTVAPVGDDLVATVVMQGPADEAPTRVYRRPGQRADTLERPIEPDELDHLFGAVDSAIGRETLD